MEEKSEGFKSRLDDVFSGLDGVGFKSDSSLKQTPFKAEEADFRRPRSPSRRSDQGCGGSSGGRDIGDGSTSERNFDKFKKTDSIFQESQDVGSWRKKDFKPSSSSGSSHSHHRHHQKRPKNPMFDHRRPQHKDPKKYTKYSLADVKDVTDKSNAQAALAFLQDRKRKHEERDEGHKDQDEGKVVFKKPKKTAQSESSSSSSSDFGLSCGNSKRVMPEAVVGQTKAKKVGLKAAKAESGSTESKASKKQNRLSHLSFEDEEED